MATRRYLVGKYEEYYNSLQGEGATAGKSNQLISDISSMVNEFGNISQIMSYWSGEASNAMTNETISSILEGYKVTQQNIQESLGPCCEAIDSLSATLSNMKNLEDEWLQEENELETLKKNQPPTTIVEDGETKNNPNHDNWANKVNEKEAKIKEQITKLDSLKEQADKAIQTIENLESQLSEFSNYMSLTGTILGIGESNEFSKYTLEERLKYLQDIINNYDVIYNSLNDLYKEKYGKGFSFSQEDFKNLDIIFDAFDIYWLSGVDRKDVCNSSDGKLALLNIDKLTKVIGFCNSSGMFDKIDKYLGGASWKESGLEEFYFEHSPNFLKINVYNENALKDRLKKSYGVSESNVRDFLKTKMDSFKGSYQKLMTDYSEYQKLTGTMAVIKEKISNLKNAQKLMPYEMAMENEDFKDYLNKDYSNYSFLDKDKLSIMSQKEKALYDYLLHNVSKEKANEYIKALDNAFNQRIGAKKAAEYIEWIKADGFDVGDLFNAGWEGTKDGVRTFFDGFADLFKVASTNEGDKSALDYELMYKAQWMQQLMADPSFIDQNTNKNWLGITDISQWYNTASSIGNMAIPALIGMIPGGQTLSSVLFGASIMGNTAVEAKQEGYTTAQAYLYGGVTGLSEAVTERLLGGIDGLSQKALGQTVLQNMFSEGFEEFVQEYMDLGARALILGEEVDLSASGINAQFNKAAEAFKQGAITAGVMDLGTRRVVNPVMNVATRTLGPKVTTVNASTGAIETKSKYNSFAEFSMTKESERSVKKATEVINESLEKINNGQELNLVEKVKLNNAISDVSVEELSSINENLSQESKAALEKASQGIPRLSKKTSSKMELANKLDQIMESETSLKEVQFTKDDFKEEITRDGRTLGNIIADQKANAIDAETRSNIERASKSEMRSIDRQIENKNKAIAKMEAREQRREEKLARREASTQQEMRDVATRTETTTQSQVEEHQSIVTPVQQEVDNTPSRMDTATQTRTEEHQPVITPAQEMGNTESELKTTVQAKVEEQPVIAPVQQETRNSESRIETATQTQVEEQALITPVVEQIKTNQQTPVAEASLGLSAVALGAQQLFSQQGASETSTRAAVDVDSKDYSSQTTTHHTTEEHLSEVSSQVETSQRNISTSTDIDNNSDLDNVEIGERIQQSTETYSNETQNIDIENEIVQDSDSDIITFIASDGTTQQFSKKETIETLEKEWEAFGDIGEAIYNVSSIEGEDYITVREMIDKAILDSDSSIRLDLVTSFIPAIIKENDIAFLNKVKSTLSLEEMNKVKEVLSKYSPNTAKILDNYGKNGFDKTHIEEKINDKTIEDLANRYRELTVGTKEYEDALNELIVLSSTNSSQKLKAIAGLALALANNSDISSLTTLKTQLSIKERMEVWKTLETIDISASKEFASINIKRDVYDLLKSSYNVSINMDKDGKFFIGSEQKDITPIMEQYIENIHQMSATATERYINNLNGTLFEIFDNTSSVSTSIINSLDLSFFEDPHYDTLKRIGLSYKTKDGRYSSGFETISAEVIDSNIDFIESMSEKLQEKYRDVLRYCLAGNDEALSYHTQNLSTLNETECNNYLDFIDKAHRLSLDSRLINDINGVDINAMKDNNSSLFRNLGQHIENIQSISDASMKNSYLYVLNSIFNKETLQYSEALANGFQHIEAEKIKIKDYLDFMNGVARKIEPHLVGLIDYRFPNSQEYSYFNENFGIVAKTTTDVFIAKSGDTVNIVSISKDIMDKHIELLKNTPNPSDYSKLFMSNDDIKTMRNNYEWLRYVSSETDVSSLMKVGTAPEYYSVLNGMKEKADLFFSDSDIHSKANGLISALRSSFYRTETSCAIANFLGSRIETMTQQTIDDALALTKRIEESNSAEIRRIYNEILVQAFKTDDPYIAIEKMKDIFEKNNLPTVGKIYKCFDSLHPNFEGFNNRIEDMDNVSPVLQESGNLRRKVTVFTDLIKATFGSNNRSVNEYLANIEFGQQIFEKLKDNTFDIDSLSSEELNELRTFKNHLITMYDNTMVGKYGETKFVESGNIGNDIIELARVLSPNGSLDYNLGDRLVDMFCGFADIKTMEQAKSYISEKISTAEKRNIEASKNPMVLEQGDLVKGIGQIDYLGDILQNGSVSREYLGAAADSDLTPLDTDLSIIETDGTIQQMIRSVAANGYGPIYFVLKNDSRFETTRTVLGRTDAVHDPSKIELFYTGKLGIDHYGIRTGFASSEINYIVMENYDPRVGLEISLNGFYIPVANMNGDIVFTYDDYLDLRNKMNGLSYYGVNEFVVDQSKKIYSPEIEKIINNMNANISETQTKSRLIWDRIESATNELGLSLKDQIDLTHGSATLFNTGSTGRFTNIPGDGDFDYTMQVDGEIYRSQEKMNKLREEIIKSLLGEDNFQYSLVNGDIRELTTTLIDENGVAHEVEIDITFAHKTDKVEYASDVCVSDRLNSIIDPKDKETVMANIIYAKQFLKEINAYKPARRFPEQGGLGGIGVENWILQNGGTFYNAARTFVEAAEKCSSFEEFKEKYTLYNFGTNHMAIKKNFYPHDNYIENMNEVGYQKMVGALKEYIANAPSLSTVETTSHDVETATREATPHVVVDETIDSTRESSSHETLVETTTDSTIEIASRTTSDETITVSTDGDIAKINPIKSAREKVNNLVREAITTVGEKITSSKIEQTPLMKNVENVTEYLKTATKEEIEEQLNNFNGKPVKVGDKKFLSFNNPVIAEMLNSKYRELTGKNHPRYVEEAPKVIDSLIEKKDKLIKAGTYTPEIFEKLKSIKELIELTKDIPVIDNFPPKDIGRVLNNLDTATAEEIEEILDYYHLGTVESKGVIYSSFDDPITAQKLNTKYRELTGENHPTYEKEVVKVVDELTNNREDLIKAGVYTEEDFKKIEAAKEEMIPKRKGIVEATRGKIADLLRVASEEREKRRAGKTVTRGNLEAINTYLETATAEEIKEQLDNFNTKAVKIAEGKYYVFNDPIIAEKLNTKYKELTGQNHPRYVEEAPKVIDRLLNNEERVVKEGTYTEEEIKQLKSIKELIELTKDIPVIDNFPPKDIGRVLNNLDTATAEEIEEILDYYHLGTVESKGVIYSSFDDPITAQKLNAKYRELTGENHPTYEKEVVKVVDELTNNREDLIKAGVYTEEDFKKIEEIRAGIAPTETQLSPIIERAKTIIAEIKDARSNQKSIKKIDKILRNRENYIKKGVYEEETLNRLAKIKQELILNKGTKPIALLERIENITANIRDAKENKKAIKKIDKILKKKRRLIRKGVYTVENLNRLAEIRKELSTSRRIKLTAIKEKIDILSTEVKKSISKRNVINSIDELLKNKDGLLKDTDIKTLTELKDKLTSKKKARTSAVKERINNIATELKDIRKTNITIRNINSILKNKDNLIKTGKYSKEDIKRLAEIKRELILNKRNELSKKIYNITEGIKDAREGKESVKRINNILKNKENLIKEGIYTKEDIKRFAEIKRDLILNGRNTLIKTIYNLTEEIKDARENKKTVKQIDKILKNRENYIKEGVYTEKALNRLAEIKNELSVNKKAKASSIRERINNITADIKDAKANKKTVKQIDRILRNRENYIKEGVYTEEALNRLAEIRNELVSTRETVLTAIRKKLDNLVTEAEKENENRKTIKAIDKILKNKEVLVKEDIDELNRIKKEIENRAVKGEVVLSDDITSSTEEVGPAIVATPSSTEEVDPATFAASSSTEEVDPAIVATPSSTEEVDPATLTATSSTEEVDPAIVATPSSTEEVDPATLTATSSTEEVDPVIVATPSSTSEDVITGSIIYEDDHKTLRLTETELPYGDSSDIKVEHLIYSVDGKDIVSYEARIQPSHSEAEIEYQNIFYDYSKGPNEQTSEYLGKGYTKEGLKVICEDLQRRGITNIGLQIADWNTASIKVAESVGFVREAGTDNYYYKPNTPSLTITSDNIELMLATQSVSRLINQFQNQASNQTGYEQIIEVAQDIINNNSISNIKIVSAIAPVIIQKNDLSLLQNMCRKLTLNEYLKVWEELYANAPEFVNAYASTNAEDIIKTYFTEDLIMSDWLDFTKENDYSFIMETDTVDITDVIKKYASNMSQLSPEGARRCLSSIKDELYMFSLKVRKGEASIKYIENKIDSMDFSFFDDKNYDIIKKLKVDYKTKDGFYHHSLSNKVDSGFVDSYVNTYLSLNKNLRERYRRVIENIMLNYPLDDTYSSLTTPDIISKLSGDLIEQYIGLLDVVNWTSKSLDRPKNIGYINQIISKLNGIEIIDFLSFAKFCRDKNLLTLLKPTSEISIQSMTDSNSDLYLALKSLDTDLDVINKFLGNVKKLDLGVINNFLENVKNLDLDLSLEQYALILIKAAQGLDANELKNYSNFLGECFEFCARRLDADTLLSIDPKYFSEPEYDYRRPFRLLFKSRDGYYYVASLNCNEIEKVPEETIKKHISNLSQIKETQKRINYIGMYKENAAFKTMSGEYEWLKNNFEASEFNVSRKTETPYVSVPSRTNGSSRLSPEVLEYRGYESQPLFKSDGSRENTPYSRLAEEIRIGLAMDIRTMYTKGNHVKAYDNFGNWFEFDFSPDSDFEFAKETVLESLQTQYVQTKIEMFDFFQEHGSVDQNATNNVTEIEIRNIIEFAEKTYGLDPTDTRILLKSINRTGACSYASACNDIYALYKNNPELFEKDFGYPMFKEDGSLNDAQLLFDLYVSVNGKIMPNILLEQSSGNNLRIKSDLLSNETKLDDSKQYYMSTGSEGLKLDVLNYFLNSKGCSLNFASKYAIIPIVEKVTETDFSDKLDEWVSDGNFISGIGIHNGVTLYNVNQRERQTIKAGEGHAVTYVGKNKRGIFVRSWGELYFIPLNQIINKESNAPGIVISRNFRDDNIGVLNLVDIGLRRKNKT